LPLEDKILPLEGKDVKMAANSGGLVDWSTIIKPFVTYSVGSLSKNEVITLLKAIVESEKDLADSAVPSHPHSVFYDVVTVLSAHVITAAACSDLLPRSSFPSACQAGRILCSSFIKRFPHIQRSSHPILSVKLYINSIHEFCSGQLILGLEEVANMLALLKTQELPSKIQSSAPSTWDKEGTAAATVKEVRRNRLDPSVLLYDQIAMPVMSIPDDKPINELYALEILQIFQSIRAGQCFVEICLALPNLRNYYSDSVSLQSDSIRNLYSKIATKNPNVEMIAVSEELNLVYRLLSMPLFAPLTSADAYKLTQLGVGAMYAAFAVIMHFYGNVSTSNQQSCGSQNQQSSSLASVSMSNLSVSENEYETGVLIVSEAIWTQKRVISILKQDTGLPQWTWLNCSLAFSKILIVSIHAYMHHVTCTADPKISAKDKERISLVSIQQVWNEMITAISVHGIYMIQNFIRIYCPDVPVQPTQHQSHSGGKHHKGSASTKSFRVDDNLTSADRIKLLFENFNTFEMLIQMATLSYRKACRLKLLKYCPKVGDMEDETENSEQLAVADQDNDNNGNNMDTENYFSLGGEKLDENEHIDVEIEDENHSVSDF
jgi:hypothetical protein